MLSVSYISPHLPLCRNQPPLQPSCLPDYRKKTKRYNLSANVVSRNNAVLYDTSSISYPTDPGVVGHWLRSCSCVEEIRKIHGVVIKSMEDPVAFVGSNLISVYVKFGDLVAARRVFDNMPERTVVSWTAMLDGYEKNGKQKEALRLFGEFVDGGYYGNEHTYVCVLNLCSRTFDYELGRQLHARTLKSGMSNVILDSAIIHFYAQCGDIDAAFRAFDRVQKRDVITWTTMITACSQNRRSEEAFVLLGQMLSDGIDPNEFTVSSILNSCSEEKELRLGKQLHCTVVKKAYDVDIYVETSLVDMYAKCGNIEDSRALFDVMKRRNAIAWTSMIAGYARNGLGEEAINLFRLMKRIKVLPNNLTMVCILRACGLLRSLPAGKELHAQIFKSFAPENIFIGSALVWLYCKCGDYSSASKVLQYLPDKDVVSWTAMISSCARLGLEYEALEHLKEMMGEGVEPNPFTYSSALKACAKLEDINQGRLIHSTIYKTPALSNVFVGSALVHMYSKCGYLSEAVQVFDSMPERNLVSWKAMIVAYARSGQCAEALKLMYRMQSEGIDVDDYILSTVLTACGDFKWNGESPSIHCLQK